jgi:hypothetical protein
MEASRKQSRGFWQASQPVIVRLYKVAGLLALTAILIGLIGFLVVNIFYFFDHSWVRPIKLDPNHAKVVEAAGQLADARLRASQLESEQLEITADLEQIDRVLKADTQFLKDVGTTADSPKTPEQWLMHHDVENTKLDVENQNGKKAPLNGRLASLKLRAKDQDAVVHRLEQSPYMRAISHNVVLAFVPNSNHSVKLGTKLYGCSWGLVMCSRVGKVTATIDGEVTDAHPHDDTIERGIMVEIELTTPSAADDKVLFAGGKPLWLF